MPKNEEKIKKDEKNKMPPNADDPNRKHGEHVEDKNYNKKKH